MRLQVLSKNGAGLEYLGFAKEKLKELADLRLQQNLPYLQRTLHLDGQAVKIFLHSSSWGDTIRISGRDVNTVKLEINGVLSSRSNRPTLLAYADSPAVARVLYGSTIGTAYDSDPLVNNYVGPAYPILCEKTVVFISEGSPAVVVRVNSNGEFPEFVQSAGGYTVWSAYSGAQKFISGDAVPYLFYAADVPAGGFYSFTTEPEDFITLSPDFEYTPWGFFVGGSEVTGDNRFHAPATPDAGAWFDRTKKYGRLVSDGETSSALEYDIMRHIDPALSESYSGYDLAARYAIGGYSAGGNFLQKLRLRVTVSGRGTFKLACWGRYENAWPSGSDSYYLDEVSGFSAAVIDASANFTCTGSNQSFELPITCFQLQDNTGNMDRHKTTGGEYTPAILEWGFSISTVDGEPLDIKILAANLMTDFLRAAINDPNFEYRTTESDTNMLMEHDLTLFDLFAAYTPQEFFSAFPEYYLWSNATARRYTGYADNWFSGNAADTYMLSHFYGYIAILSMREAEDLAGGYFSGPTFDSFPTWPENFRIMSREFYKAGNQTLEEIIRTDKVIRFSDCLVSRRLRRVYDYPSYPASSPPDIQDASGLTVPMKGLGVDALTRYGQPAVRRVHRDSVLNFMYYPGTFWDATDPTSYYRWDIHWPGNVKTRSVSVTHEGESNLVPYFSALDPAQVVLSGTALIDIRMDCVSGGIVVDTQARNELVGALSTAKYNI